jgi:hypothetical protein
VFDGSPPRQHPAGRRDVGSQTISPTALAAITAIAAGQQNLHVYSLDELSASRLSRRSLNRRPQSDAQFADSRGVLSRAGRISIMPIETRQARSFGDGGVDVDFRRKMKCSPVDLHRATFYDESSTA